MKYIAPVGRQAQPKLSAPTGNTVPKITMGMQIKRGLGNLARGAANVLNTYVGSSSNDSMAQDFTNSQKAGALHKSKRKGKKNWIKGAIKHPGALHRELGVPEGKKIPTTKLAAAAKKGGKEGKRARLAETLKKLKHKKMKKASTMMKSKKKVPTKMNKKMAKKKNKVMCKKEHKHNSMC